MKKINYSEKSVAVYGNTKEHRLLLKSLGAKFCPALTIDGEKVAGWVFGLNQFAKVEKYLPIEADTPAEVSAPVINEVAPVPAPVPTKKVQNVAKKKDLDLKKLYNVVANSLFINIESDGKSVLIQGNANFIELDVPHLPVFVVEIDGRNRSMFEEIITNLNIIKVVEGQLKCGAITLNCRHESNLDKFKNDIVNGNYTKFWQGNTSTLQEFVPFAGKDQIRPVIMGIYFDLQNEKIVATDAHFLRADKTTIIGKHEIDGVDIPAADVINKYPKNANVELSVSEDNLWVCANFGNVKVYGRSIDGKYPNYEAVIPFFGEYNEIVKIDANTINKAEKLVKIAQDSQKTISFVGDKMICKSANGVFEEASNVMCSAIFGMDVEKLKKVYQARGTDLNFEFSTPSRALVDRTENSTILVMPCVVKS